jgi:hypothetical protein
MNKRIQEIAQQAGLQPFEDCGPGYVYKMEKFAELIVRECLQQCEQIRDDAYTQKKSEYLTESGRLIYEGVFGGATNCGFAIQQHFGVEL